MASGGTCGYTHDVSGERFDDIEGATWTCSRVAADGRDRCPFHAPADAVSDDAARERLLDAVDDGQGPIRLLGARVGTLDLDYAILDGPSNHPIDFREATIDGLSGRYSTFDRPVRLEGAVLSGTVDFEDATFSRQVDFGGVTFEERVSFRMADFQSWLDLRDADFLAPVYARVARFRRGVYGVESTFHDAADFLNARFDDVANFYRAAFRSGAVFNNSTFEGNAQFNEARFEAPTVRLVSETGSPRSAGETMEGVALSLDGATCERDFRLVGTAVDGDVRFRDCDLGRDLRCTDLSAVGTREIVIDCTGSSTISGEVVGDDGRVVYDMTDAVVGEITIADGASFDVFRFDGTTFSGFDFGTYKQDLAARGWQLHTADRASEPERLENLYLRAKNGAKEVGETGAAAEFFIREMRSRRIGHRRRMREADGVIEWGRAASSWLSNTALKHACGYGERPFRPATFSVFLIVAFAGLYAVMDAPITYAKPLGYLTFSIEGFVSIVLGLPEASDSSLSFILATEGFLGGFIIALFVFTLTRSISR